MLLEIVSYNGHTLNDTTISAWFPSGMPVMPSADKKYAPRVQNFQKLASKEVKEPSFYFHVELKGTIHSQLETLKAWFPLLDYVPRAFVVKDTADSNRQWYVMGYAVTPPMPVEEDGAGEYVIEMAIDEPLWRTVTASTDAWEITASGQTNSLTVLGNYPARPIFTITVSSAKNGGYAYKQWKPWYNPLTIENGEPLEVTGGGLNTSALINDTTVSNQLAAAIDADDLTFPVDTAVGGGLNTAGGMMYVGTEQIYYTGIAAGTVTVYNSGGVTGRGWGGTTAAVHADNAVCARSKILANGNDLRVSANKAEVDRWITGINTTTTKVWIKQRYKAAVTLTSDTVIASSGDVTSITVEKTKANLAALKLLPATFMFYIGSEVFFGYNSQPTAYKFSVSSRAEKGTSMAAHAKKAVIRLLEHDVYLMWGNALAEAPEVDATKEPTLDKTNSTNTSWVHAIFSSEDGLRPASWKNGVVKQTGSESYSYTGPEATFADPATEIGFAVKAWAVSGAPKAENFIHTWSLYHPAGFTAITATGKKRRLSTDWIKFTFEYLVTTKWAVLFTEATPAASGSFGALSSHSAVAISGAPKTVKFQGNGTLKGTTGNENDFEVDATTLGINSSNVMQAAFATSVEDNVYLDCTLTVVESGESISLRGLTSVDAEIVVDCDAETITVNGNDGDIDIQWNTVRSGWLDLPSTAQHATCTLSYVETGAAGVDIDTEWENRNTL